MEEESLTDYYFIVEFPASNTFRQILDFLFKSGHRIVPLIFSKDSLSIRKSNDKNTIIFDGVIHAHNLTFFYVNPDCLSVAGSTDPEDPEGVPEFFIHVPITALMTNLKRSQKKQRVRLSYNKSNDGFLTIRSEESSSVYSEIKIEPSKKPPINIKLCDALPIETPNVTMQLSGSHFSASGKLRVADKVSKIQVFRHGAQIISSSAQGDSSKIPKGDCTGDYICEIKIPGDIMTSISKFASLSLESIMRIYCNDENYIRIEIPISVIGTAYIYLMTRDFSE
jgi:hypothetical protein